MQIVDSSNRNLGIVVLTENETESHAREIGWGKCLNSEHDLNARPNGGKLFMVRANMQVAFNPNLNRVVTLAFKLGEESLVYCEAMPSLKSQKLAEQKDPFIYLYQKPIKFCPPPVNLSWFWGILITILAQRSMK